MGFNVRSSSASALEEGVTTWSCLEQEIEGARKLLKRNEVDMQALLSEVEMNRQRVQALLPQKTRNAPVPASYLAYVRNLIAINSIEVEEPLPILHIAPGTAVPVEPEHHVHPFGDSQVMTPASAVA